MSKRKGRVDLRTNRPGKKKIMSNFFGKSKTCNYCEEEIEEWLFIWKSFNPQPDGEVICDQCKDILLKTRSLNSDK